MPHLVLPRFFTQFLTLKWSDFRRITTDNLMIQWYSRLFFNKLMRKMTTNMTLQRKTTNNFILQGNRVISFTGSFILRAINKHYILTMLLILLLPLLVWSHTEERKKEAWENKHDTYVYEDAWWHTLICAELNIQLIF